MIPSDKMTVSWILNGPMCRDCADANGVCPNDGMPCDPDMAEKAVRTIISRINYGLSRGYLILVEGK